MQDVALPRTFYERDALQLARDLLGCILVHQAADGRTAGFIVETEAYRGPEDQAAHSFRGKRTARTEVMYGPAGHAYIYLIYGMYDCFNIVGGCVGSPEAVLVRALEPVEGISLMATRRGLSMDRAHAMKTLCSGPGKLTRAMGITRAAHYGMDLCGATLYVTTGRTVPNDEIAATPRINVDYAGEWRDLPWRFVVKHSPFLSRPWRST